MKVWIGDFRVESTLVLPPDVTELRVKLADGEFTFQNATRDDLPNEALAAQITIHADTIAEAEEIAKKRVNEVLDVLSFITSSKFRISRQRFLMDWSPGLKMRDQYAYGCDKKDDRWPDLAEEYLKTVAAIETLDGAKRLRAPLHWFAAGIRATAAEDQFQYFWFVLEIIAEITKETGLVADKCQKCKSDLFCQACNSISMHKPFQRQAIDNLLDRLNVPADVRREMFIIRNGIMHGRDRDEIIEEIRRKSPDFEFGEAIDIAWQIATAAIFNALQITAPQYNQMYFAKPDSVVSRDISFKAHMIMGLPGDPNDPKLVDVVIPEVRAFRVNSRGEEIDPLTGQRINNQG
jgi:hypothetical protein